VAAPLFLGVFGTLIFFAHNDSQTNVDGRLPMMKGREKS
jgi:hypothetical protein